MHFILLGQWSRLFSTGFSAPVLQCLGFQSAPLLVHVNSFMNYFTNSFVLLIFIIYSASVYCPIHSFYFPISSCSTKHLPPFCSACVSSSCRFFWISKFLMNVIIYVYKAHCQPSSSQCFLVLSFDLFHFQDMTFLLPICFLVGKVTLSDQSCPLWLVLCLFPSSPFLWDLQFSAFIHFSDLFLWTSIILLHVVCEWLFRWQDVSGGLTGNS